MVVRMHDCSVERQLPATEVPSRLNLGCGEDYREQWHNVDIRSAVDPDEEVNLNVYPWPWDDDTFQLVLARHVIEHLDDQYRALDELARITAANGQIRIRCPHWNSASQAIDPTHTTPVDPRTLRHALAPDWNVEDVQYTRVRIGRLLPERIAVWIADMVGHVVTEWEATIRLPKETV
ncbi:class I SAM-dependent methyltransferase [Halomicroarcula sp. F13]|uniref:Class I SAM-dependent methyltransferase n=1 Tax=Haloarcula rubra TaxID=2487747 RepID=A0AAW4PUQ8_9EURY|nr:methyltransferase domain-containing protein [Halomicroarcula rubra]MBX0325418.1 class I SAM-dependent methyltransferase [Halomicroarcula rubra]